MRKGSLRVVLRAIRCTNMTWNYFRYWILALLNYDVQLMSPAKPLFFFFLLIIWHYQVRRKDFWLLSTVKRVLKEFIPSLCHDADGLIFQVRFFFLFVYYDMKMLRPVVCFIWPSCMVQSVVFQTRTEMVIVV